MKKSSNIISISCACAVLLTSFSAKVTHAEEPLNVSGVYPSLTMWNTNGECGTGAVVLWAGDLWAITYAPHMPNGSSDKLYQFTPDLKQIIFEGSVGGTPANRMIHRETNQLLIGPYLVDEKKNIRVIPPDKMFGRLTGTARHLTHPESKAYYATMEEGLYEVDLKTLEVKCFIQDGNKGAPDVGVKSELPGYHGKGLYTGLDRLIYANNGDRDPKVRVDPTVTSGALAQWFGEGDWQLVRRNQFTEVTGPGGIYGNANPATDPVWAMGWDAKSVILALLENKQWHYFRLPKGSHSYDGAHGWNTEWPRIREIGEEDFLATMHGTFWRFPGTFSLGNSGGIAPRSNYLKVIGDFCKWNDRIVLGCDDSAKAEFLNTRPFKAKHAAPAESNSNLWFIEPERLDDIGPVIGRGSVWLRDDIKADQASDPYLFSGYDFRQLHLTHGSDSAVTFVIEVDKLGNNSWEALKEISVPAGEPVSTMFPAETESGAWVRLTPKSDASQVTAHFQYRNRDTRELENDSLFAGIAPVKQTANTTGVMRSLSHEKMGLVAATAENPNVMRYYEINQKLELVPVDAPKEARKLVAAVKQPGNSYTIDEASILLIEDGKRYRLPRNPDYDQSQNVDVAGSSAVKGKTLADYMPDSLARDVDVTVSSTHLSYDAKFAVDGDIADDNKRWVSSADGEKSIELDLGSAKIQSLWVVSGWNGEPAQIASDFDVLYQNGDEWKLLPGGEIRGNKQTQCEIRLKEPVTVQKLRFVSKSESHFRIYEIAAFDKVLEISQPDIAFGPARVCREVATERDLLNVHGTFYELPARNAQGMAKIRPVATHNLAIQDFCSHNGLLFFTGIDAETESPHIFRSEDGNAAVWAGVVDDLWKLGKPRGEGGPWKNSAAKKDVPSDPYLMTAYDNKSLMLSADKNLSVTAEIDIDGTGLWVPMKSWDLEAGKDVEYDFPEGFSAYWIRFSSSEDATVSAVLKYD